MLRPIHALVVLLALCGPATAQPLDETDAIRRAAVGLFGWFKEMQFQVAELVGSAEKRQLVLRLKELRKDLFDLEQDKRFFLDEIRQERLDHDQLDLAVDDITETIRITQRSLRESTLLLRDQFRNGGIQAERILDDALGERKQWTSRLDQALASGELVSASDYAQEIEAAIESLRQASIELTKLIASIEEA